MIHFELTIEEANLIISGLQELPAKISMPLILKLQTEGQKQFEEQQKQPPVSIRESFDAKNEDTGV